MIKKIILIIVVILLVIFGIYIYKRPNNQPTPETDSQVKSENIQTTQKNKSISGQDVSEEKAKTRPIAVMIENHPDARPQAGLTQAEIVYEVLAEGGITRFLAIFQASDPEQIGPVRSARPYFAEIANEWGAIYTHVGGSDETIEKLKNNFWKKLEDVNEYYNGDYFVRLKNKYAPHNIYTSYEEIKSLEKDKKWTSEINKDTPRLTYSNTDTTGEPHTPKICMDFSSPSYQVCYSYNEQTKNYPREMGQEKHIDELTKTQIAPKNVLVQFVEVADIPNDPKLRIKIDLNSNGEALLFSGGKAKIAKWKKNSQGITDFTDEQGNPLIFTPGQTWVELIPTYLRSKLIWKQQNG